MPIWTGTKYYKISNIPEKYGSTKYGFILHLDELYNESWYVVPRDFCPHDLRWKDSCWSFMNINFWGNKRTSEGVIIEELTAEEMQDEVNKLKMLKELSCG